jgi:hypothetical protein
MTTVMQEMMVEKMLHQQNEKGSWSIGVIAAMLLEAPREWEGTPEASRRYSLVWDPPGAFTKPPGCFRINSDAGAWPCWVSE